MRKEVNPNVQISMLVNTQSKGGFQWKRVFYSQANITGSKRQLLVIIDSGCTNNLIYEEVVRQMECESTPHPKPYSMGWVQEGHEVHVSCQAIVPFEIGTYREEV